MPKAILELEMPESCAECPCKGTDVWGMVRCRLIHMKSDKYSGMAEGYAYKRRTDCPLKLVEDFDTIEALQQENNGWRERYDELDTGHSRLFKDFCKLQQENEQLQAQVARMWEALRKAREAIKAAWSVGSVNAAMDKAREALAEIDKVIGGKEE